ncbi:MAG: LytR/AlgR family response regulator transcription factor, partial [Sarcina sp.]
MLNIFVCITSEEERASFTKIVETTVFVENLDMKITKVTGNPYDILEMVKKRREPAIYFLNVFFEGDINGIQLGAKLREYDELGVIVYITQHIELLYLSYIYKVEALDYIIKNDVRNLEERVNSCLQRAEKKLSADNIEMKKIKIKQGDIIFNISIDDIYYFETSEKPHKLILHKKNEKLEFVGNLKSLEGSIGDNFFRCHKSYLINKSKVKEINTKKKIVLMDNNEVCLVSKRFLNDLID